MENQFTPGPWKVNDNIGRKSELGIVASAAPCIVAVMGNAKEWPVQADANARLIAAAPALYDALKLAVPALTYLAEKEPGHWAKDADAIEAALALVDSKNGEL